MSRLFKIFLLVVLSVFSTLNLSANDTFFSIEKQSSSVKELADAGDEVADLLSYSANKVDLNIGGQASSFGCRNCTPQGMPIEFDFEFIQGKIKILDEDGDLWTKGRLDFVIKSDGTVNIGRRHYSLANQEDVLGAGQFLFKDGDIIAINNASGHFKPSLMEAKLAYKKLQELGWPLGNTFDHSIDFSLTNWETNFDQMSQVWTNQLQSWGN